VVIPTTLNVFVPGPHGGLTVVHGGGNLPLSIQFDMTTAANSVTRADGLAWTDDGYTQYFASGLPQHIQVGNAIQTRTINSFSNTACPYSDPFPGCGVGSVINFTAGEPALGAGTAKNAGLRGRAEALAGHRLDEHHGDGRVRGAAGAHEHAHVRELRLQRRRLHGRHAGHDHGTQIVGSGQNAVITNVGIRASSRSRALRWTASRSRCGTSP
jgi:hypothetical protein